MQALHGAPEARGVDPLPVARKKQDDVQHHPQRQAAKYEMLDHVQSNEDQMVGIAQRGIAAVRRFYRDGLLLNQRRHIRALKPGVPNQLVIERNVQLDLSILFMLAYCVMAGFRARRDPKSPRF